MNKRKKMTKIKGQDICIIWKRGSRVYKERKDVPTV